MHSVPAFSLNTSAQPGYRPAGAGTVVENRQPAKVEEKDAFAPDMPPDSATGTIPPPNTPAEPNAGPLSRPAFPLSLPFPVAPSANVAIQPVQDGFFWPGRPSPGASLPLPRDTWAPLTPSSGQPFSREFPSAEGSQSLKTLTATKPTAIDARTSLPQRPNAEPDAFLRTGLPSTGTDALGAKPEKGHAAVSGDSEKLLAKEMRQHRKDKAKNPDKMATADAKSDKTAVSSSGDEKTAAKSSVSRQEGLESETGVDAPSEEKHVSIFSQFMEARQKPTEAEKPASRTKKRDNDASSKMVAAYKIFFAVCGVGFLNAFLFGSPLLVSIGLALAFAGAQSYLALKVAKEDNWISRGMMAMSRWLTGSENDKTQSGKERAMAPVWAVVSSALALVEAGLNIGGKALASKFSSVDKLGFQHRTLDSILADLKRKQGAKPGGLVDFQVKVVEFLKENSDKMAKRQEAMRELVQKEPSAVGWKKVRNNLFRFLAEDSFKNGRGLLWAGISGFVGGYVLSILAAKVHENFEKKFQATAPQPSSSPAA